MDENIENKHKTLSDIDINDYNYFLPEERIAQYPLDNRDESKLLFFNKKNDVLSHNFFYNLPELLPANSILVRNVSKVFPARFFLSKSTGGKVEVLLENPISFNLPQIALTKQSPQIWQCTMRGKNLKPGLVLFAKYEVQSKACEFQEYTITSEILEEVSGKRNVKFHWEPANLSLAEFLSEVGKTPLPPYIHRNPEETDKIKYQTIFAKYDGSIAAPTAGLHFTANLDNALRKLGIQIEEIVLHVGSGTFQPMKSNQISEHNMHFEQFQISLAFLENLLESFKAGKKIIATGTTTVRTLETLFWLGNKFKNKQLNPGIPIILNQWDWVDLISQNLLSPTDALQNLIDILKEQSMSHLYGQTQLFIVPGYEFQMIDAMITNFHLPKSTLLLLVAAFIGKSNYEKIYKSALQNDYRFLSYGDSSLLLK